MHISYIYSRQTTDFLKLGLSSHSIFDVLKDLQVASGPGGADGASNAGAVRMGEAKTGGWTWGKNGIWMGFHGLWLLGIHKQA